MDFYVWLARLCQILHSFLSAAYFEKYLKIDYNKDDYNKISYVPQASTFLSALIQLYIR